MLTSGIYLYLWLLKCMSVHTEKPYNYYFLITLQHHNWSCDKVKNGTFASGGDKASINSAEHQ